MTVKLEITNVPDEIWEEAKKAEKDPILKAIMQSATEPNMRPEVVFDYKEVHPLSFRKFLAQVLAIQTYVQSVKNLEEIDKAGKN